MESKPPRRYYNSYWTRGPICPRILLTSTLSFGAKLCYMALDSFTTEDNKDASWPSQETLGKRYGADERSVRRHLRELEDADWIEIHQVGLHRTNRYLFLSLEDKANRIHPLDTDPEWDGIPAIPDRSELSGQKKSYEADRSELSGQERSAVSGPIEYDLTLYTTKPLSPIVPFSEKPKPPDNSEPDDCRSTAPPREAELCLEDGTAQFLFFAYKRHGMIGRIKAKRDAREIARFESLERTEGTAEARLMFLGYLGTRSPWLEENKWPLTVFLNNPAVYATGDMEPDPAFHRTSGHSGMPSRQTTPYTEPSSGPDPDPIPPQPALPTPADIVAAWNTLIPEKAVSASSRPAVLRDQEFVAVHADVFAKVRARLDEKRPDDWWIDFGWVCGTKDGVANWNKIRSGKLSGSFTNGSAKPSAADRHRALAEKVMGRHFTPLRMPTQ